VINEPLARAAALPCPFGNPDLPVDFALAEGIVVAEVVRRRKMKILAAIHPPTRFLVVEVGASCCCPRGRVSEKKRGNSDARNLPPPQASKKPVE